jgi:hypothetical protein
MFPGVGLMPPGVGLMSTTVARSQKDLSAGFQKKFGQTKKNSAFFKLLFLSIQ